jgi:NCAIR mutase (PurE)-related protein
MQLQFPIHIREKWIERGFDVDHIKQVIRHPDYQIPESEGRILARKKIDTCVLEVIYVKGNSKNKFVIITAYYK